MSNTPTLDKMIAIQEQSQLCGEFLEWLQSKYAMFDKKQKRDSSVFIGNGDYIYTEKVLADFFEIDLDEAEREREKILNSILNEDILCVLR